VSDRQFDLFSAGAARERRETRSREEDLLPFEPSVEPDFSAETRAPLGRRVAQPRAQILTQARSLAGAIAADLGRPVRLFVTDNRSTMVSFRRSEGLLTLRLHHMFLEAPPRVVDALVSYAGRGHRGAGAVIDEYVRSRQSAIRQGRDRRAAAALKQRGRVYDLQAIYERVNLAFFDGRIEAQIGWGRAVGGRRRRTIRMGVYDHQTRTIRIHPALDRPEVPAFFVDYIVFHEMLHQAVPGKLTGARKQHHGPEFRAREKRYPDYQRARAWEKQNLGLLLGKSSAARVRPVD
jgi:hypothetical protein